MLFYSHAFWWCICIKSMYSTCWKRFKILNINNHVSNIFLFSLKNKYTGKIAVGVGDQQTSSLPLIYQKEFSDINLKIGHNILSQNWRQQKLAANYFSDKNSFRYICIYIQCIYTKHLYILLHDSLNFKNDYRNSINNSWIH